MATDTGRSQSNNGRPRIERVALLGAIFVVGGLLASLGAPPFPMLHQGMMATLTLAHELTRSRPDLLAPSPYKVGGLVAQLPEASQPGPTLIQGILPGGVQLRIIDSEGRELHRWEIDLDAIWDRVAMDHVSPAANVPKSDWDYHSQGFWPLPDGSVVVNVSDLGAARLGKCGQVIWRLDRMAHHAVTPSPGGKFWIPGHIRVDETPQRLLPRGMSPVEIERMIVGKGHNYNNSIMLVNSNGVVEKEFSVLEAVTEAGLENALYASLQEVPADPTHLNDVEVVTEALAARIPDAAPGDLLVSLRNMSMLAILDKSDGSLVWHRQGPWLRQHDPDILPDGTIQLFNNRARVIGDGVRSSQILSYDPATDRTDVLHPVGEQDRFYTPIMGTHQRLANGNRLITESMAGRVFEVTPGGRVVWDYRLAYDGEVAALFEAAQRPPPDYLDVDDWNCTEN